MLERFAVVDFETLGIGPRPGEYPPEPVGVAIRWSNGASEYLAFDHRNADGSKRTDNPHTREEAVRAVRYAFEKHTVIFHNAKFDMEIAWQWFGLQFPKRWHDTLLLTYLQSPDEFSLALKPLSEKYLGMPPAQRDLVKDWVLKNVPGAKRSNFGAFIARAPVSLVGPYAIGDVERTWGLFNYMGPSVMANMPVAYERERRLLPHLTAAEKRGIRVDRPVLYGWQIQLQEALVRCDTSIRAALNDSNLDIDSDIDLGNALEREGLMTHWETPDGIPFPVVGKSEVPAIVGNPFGADTVAVIEAPPPRRSVSKGALARCCIDKTLVTELSYRNAAATMLRVFVMPWLEASATDGRLHTEWHQVRGTEKNGTRTGRIASARPNLANVPNPNETPPPFGLPPLPDMRKALLPEEGCIWISADYSQQELRITAHYENDAMKHAYVQNPKLDLHAFAQNLIKIRLNKLFPRKHIKNVAFASIYGAGIPKLARMMEVSEDEAEEVRDSYFVALPGLGKLIEAVKRRTQQVGYVRSLGGRLLPVEPPAVVDGKRRTFDYKQTNKLIQGSAADMTKEAIALYCEAGGSGYFMSQVYDEINISVPLAYAADHAQLLVACMVKAMPLDVPILVDVECGPSWGELTELKL